MPRIRIHFLLAVCAVVLPALAGAQAHHSYYLDCSRAVGGSGNSPASAWNDLRTVNTHSFAPGDAILLRRGTVCHGTLALQGSGNANSPIRLSVYGEGERPRVIATASAEAALRLFNQEYWEINSLDLSGSRTFGVFISGDKGVLHHVYLKNLAIHDVVGGEMRHKDQCAVTQNEAFLTDSPGVDGGAFDIDYGNTGNSVIESYGHDTQG